ncbi:MAG TPA: multicopper oxidase domain-containing protein, partial [Allosphingosinicella sp.]|nr:multicopper oxidase domain-containing protein [Allosphingosinicella sp.]
MECDRRGLLRTGGAAALVGLTPLGACARRSGAPAATERADHTIRIADAKIELAPGVEIATTAYDGRFPGPLIRLREGRRTIVDIHNGTGRPEQLHWHGQRVPVDVDGSQEEGTPFIPANGMRRIAFAPGPAGLRFYHSHVTAGADLDAGQYGGQAGPVYIDPRDEPGRYDREVFLVLKEFAPSLGRGGDMDMGFLAGDEDSGLKSTGEAAMQASLKRGMPKGYEVGYKHFTINGRKLGAGDPIRVRRGERVLFHILNASATEIRGLALPGHAFRVVAMDGNPVPVPAEVPVLWLGTAERISAIVEMNRPGIWILGDTSDDDRGNGMGVVVEYAGATGRPRWAKPAGTKWDYGLFARPGATAAPPDEIFDMVFAKDNAALNGFNRWTINGIAFDDAHKAPLLMLRQGRRYRLRMANQSDDIHPVHLHRHSFELARIAGRPIAGVVKDVVMLGGY